MEQWTEETSLRLLELIASTAIASPATAEVPAHFEAPADSRTRTNLDAHAASDPSDLRRVGNAAAVAEVLAALATSDQGFRQWLGARSSALTTEQPSAAGCDWQRIADHWLSWLAAEPITHTAPTADAGPFADAMPTSSPGGPLDLDQSEGSGQTRRRNALYRRVLVASAQAALRTRGLIAEREQIARELAYDMAYGLSHELNNPLANIATRARLLAEEEPSERKKQLLSAIVDQAMRGCEMIADLMLIARPPAAQFQPVELGSLVREILAKARPWTEARGLSVMVHLPEQAITVTTDRSALAEAVWAILRNAIEVARRQITVTVSVVPSTSKPSEIQHATLGIQDDGPGISPLAQAHAFNPFFSGREAGRGLGVGLAKADRIARLSRGSVSIANAVDGGCVARIVLPIHCE